MTTTITTTTTTTTTTTIKTVVFQWEDGDESMTFLQ